ncbi:hypothetical protein [Pseudanabaena sp. BC1403]|uniref:hypothetical protein n=1 Tax=Pseudanabaena sp. BC1403 TaxID=2043171 RepID=UPI000CD972C8|nr:hypothetical protein [Pseudanabaena sp. BC1403]
MSQIKSFKLPSSFDIYNTEPHLTLDPVSKINIFVGSNNSGKSRFLRMLSTQDKHDISLADVSLSLINEQIRQILSELRKLMSENELDKIREFSEKSIDNLMELPDFISLNSDSYQSWRDDFKSWEAFPEITSIDMALLHE